MCCYSKNVLRCTFLLLLCFICLIEYYFMKEQEIQQIKQLIDNYAVQYKKVPFFQDLANHAQFGVFFQWLDKKNAQIVQSILHDYIEEKIASFSTKGGELFRRFYDVHSDIFWQFRQLNMDEKSSEKEPFQKIGKDVEQILFTYEGILTEKMLNRAEWLDKTLAAFYDIVYMFFPLYGRIQ